MKVSAIKNYGLTSFTNKTTEPQDTVKQNSNTALYTGAALVGATILATTAYYIISRGKKPASVKLKNIISAEQLQNFKTQMNQFPKDIEYRKALLSGLNLEITEPAYLRPIAGPEEIKSIVKTFNDKPIHYSPGKSLISEAEDGFDLSGVENETFRANLHMHTTHSDGKLTIQELLDRSAQYADKIAEKAPQEAPNAPFTIAITDHDTVEGCKEAVKIIASNPEKYKNLRVVLGCELSVENKMIPQQLKSPIPIHMLIHGINPFDSALGTFLEKTKVARVELVNKMLAKASEKLQKDFPKTAKKLSYKDAKNLYPAFKHRILHMDYCTKDYLQFRTIFSECFELNPEIQAVLTKKNITTDYTVPKIKFFDKLPNNYGHQYWKKYLHALQKYTAELLEISESEASKKIAVSPKLEQVLSELEQISNQAKPQLKLGPEFNDMEEAINVIKSQNNGFVTIAHPGLTGIGEVLQDPSQSLQAMSDLFKTFKQKGGERALGAEIHYHYFGALGKSTEWLNNIKTYVKNAELLNTGGIDTHGTSIFHSSKDLA